MPEGDLGQGRANSDAGDASTPPGTSRRVPVHRRLTWVLAATVFSVLGGVAIWQAASSSSRSTSGALVEVSHKPAPDFSLPDIAVPARLISLAHAEGRPMVLNFWASWCVPCRTEMPLLEKANREWRGRIEFIGIDTNDTKGEALAILARVQVTYPSAFDPTGTLAQTYGLYGLPVTVFISANGRIQGRHIGELYAVTLQAALSQAFPNVHPG